MLQEAADSFGRLASERMAGSLNSMTCESLNYQADTYRRIGDLLATTKRPNEAEKAFMRGLELYSQAIEMNLGDPYMRRGRSWVYARMGQWGKAEADLAKILEM